MGSTGRLAGISMGASMLKDGTDGRLYPCASAVSPVPADRHRISGAAYQSSLAEWLAGGKERGFACLAFALSGPRRFQYSYEATDDSFIIRAHGDLDGDGIFSTFELAGVRRDIDAFQLEPQIREYDPDE